MCIPRLLDDIHPFITLTLLICPQLQRLLSIMTKHDEEVVLSRQEEREKLFPYMNQRAGISTTGLVHCADSLMMTWFGCSFEILATTNQADRTIAYNCISYLYSFIAQIHPKSVPQTRHFGRRAHRQGDRLAEGGWLHKHDVLIELNHLICGSRPHQCLIVTIKQSVLCLSLIMSNFF